MATSSAAWRTNGPRAKGLGSRHATAIASTAAAPPTTRASTPSTWRRSRQCVKSAADKLGFNAKFIIEMGEEAGSKGLAELVAANKADFAADVLVASDGPRVKPERPDHDARLPRRHQLRSRLRPARGRPPLRQLGRADRQSRRSSWHTRWPRSSDPRASCWCRHSSRRACPQAVKECLADVEIDGGEAGPAGGHLVGRARVCRRPSASMPPTCSTSWPSRPARLAGP